MGQDIRPCTIVLDVQFRFSMLCVPVVCIKVQSPKHEVMSRAPNYILLVKFAIDPCFIRTEKSLFSPKYGYFFQTLNENLLTVICQSFCHFCKTYFSPTHRLPFVVIFPFLVHHVVLV